MSIDFSLPAGVDPRRFTTRKGIQNEHSQSRIVALIALTVRRTGDPRVCPAEQLDRSRTLDQQLELGTAASADRH
jgi:hypothetical protein